MMTKVQTVSIVPKNKYSAKADGLPHPARGGTKVRKPFTRGFPRSYESVRPSAPPWYSRLAVLAACASPLISERLVPAVPCNRLHPLHALSTPAATCSVLRHPAGLSQERDSALVLTTLEFLTTRLRKVHLRSSLRCTPAQVLLTLFLQRTLPTALYRSSLEAV